jgi:hypothetical protein
MDAPPASRRPSSGMADRRAPRRRPSRGLMQRIVRC